MKDYVGWHIELTRKCGLKCPACPRTYDSHTTQDLKTDINTQDLLHFFSPEMIRKLKYIYFQGNLGDPIYHPDFHQIAEHFFSAQHLGLTTNGMQSKGFWNQVLSSWPSHSTITFSIDGLQDTNSIYRAGSKWQTLEELFQLIRTTPRKCELEWKFIVFEHNKHQIEEARELAKNIGFDVFRIQKSRPLFEEMTLNGTLQPYWESTWDEEPAVYLQNELDPFCMTGDMHYINAHGQYSPCCWLPSANSTKQSTSPDPLNISSSDIHDFHQYFNIFKKQLETFSSAPSTCQSYCRKKVATHTHCKTPNSQWHRQFTRFRSTDEKKTNIF